MTATFRMIYVFVVLEVGTRRIVHWTIAAHPTAAWTGQQFRMVVEDDQAHRFVIHDRDTIYSEGIDATLAAMGLIVLKTPVRAPQANAFCERLIGTIRRECLDFVIPINQRHLRAVLQEWVTHYNRGRHTRVWGLAFLTLGSISSSTNPTTVAFCRTIESSPRRFWLGSITNTAWCRRRRNTGAIVEDNCGSQAVEPTVRGMHPIIESDHQAAPCSDRPTS